VVGRKDQVGTWEGNLEPRRGAKEDLLNNRGVGVSILRSPAELNVNGMVGRGGIREATRDRQSVKRTKRRKGTKNTEKAKNAKLWLPTTKNHHSKKKNHKERRGAKGGRKTSPGVRSRWASIVWVFGDFAGEVPGEMPRTSVELNK